MKNQWLSSFFTTIPQQYSIAPTLCCVPVILLRTATVFPTDLHSVPGLPLWYIYVYIYTYIYIYIYTYWFTFTALRVCCIKPSVDFRIGLNENANSFFATRCRFWSVKNSCFPGNAEHKAALHSHCLMKWKLNRPTRPITAD